MGLIVPGALLLLPGLARNILKKYLPAIDGAVTPLILT